MCRLILKEQHDDIFLLRYILSFGSAEKSKEAVAFAVEWFARPVNRFFMEKLERGEDIGLMSDMEVKKRAKASFPSHLFRPWGCAWQDCMPRRSWTAGRCSWCARACWTWTRCWTAGRTRKWVSQS
jgi:hypothetical protein